MKGPSSGYRNFNSGVSVTTSSLLGGALNGNFATLKVNGVNVSTESTANVSQNVLNQLNTKTIDANFASLKVNDQSVLTKTALGDIDLGTNDITCGSITASEVLTANGGITLGDDDKITLPTSYTSSLTLPGTGQLGNIKTNSGSATAVNFGTTDTVTNVTSVTLEAGVWLIQARYTLGLNGGTCNITGFKYGVSTGTNGFAIESCQWPSAISMVYNTDRTCLSTSVCVPYATNTTNKTVYFNITPSYSGGTTPNCTVIYKCLRIA